MADLMKQFEGHRDPLIIGTLAVMDLDLLPNEHLRVATVGEWRQGFQAAACMAQEALLTIQARHSLARDKHSPDRPRKDP